MASWVPEESFQRGFSICDYWRAKCDRVGKRRRQQRVEMLDDTNNSDDGDGGSEDESINPPFEVVQVTEHKEEDGVTKYLTTWKGFLCLYCSCCFIFFSLFFLLSLSNNRS